MDQPRAAPSARSAEREYGIARDRIRAAIRAGELRAARLGRLTRQEKATRTVLEQAELLSEVWAGG